MLCMWSHHLPHSILHNNYRQTKRVQNAQYRTYIDLITYVSITWIYNIIIIIVYKLHSTRGVQK